MLFFFQLPANFTGREEKASELLKLFCQLVDVGCSDHPLPPLLRPLFDHPSGIQDSICLFPLWRLRVLSLKVAGSQVLGNWVALLQTAEGKGYVLCRGVAGQARCHQTLASFRCPGWAHRRTGLPSVRIVIALQRGGKRGRESLIKERIEMVTLPEKWGIKTLVDYFNFLLLEHRSLTVMLLVF